MLDQQAAAWGAADCTLPGEGHDRLDRSSGQYTLKGVDPESIELMRAAARREGMKIGAWASARMKEAAQRSLAIAEQAGGALASRTAVDSDRLRRIEDELAEIAKIQRVIMARMLSEGK